MAQIPVRFVFHTGIRPPLFSNARLSGSWDASGRPSEAWSFAPMAAALDAHGCPCFEAEIGFDRGAVGELFRWGVVVDGPGGADRWAVAVEHDRVDSRERHLVFTLADDATAPVQRYFLTQSYRLGAHKVPSAAAAGKPGICFAVWAPNARKVEVVLADPDRGYIADDGAGIVARPEPVPLIRAHDGVWWAAPVNTPALGDFGAFAGRPYMYRVTKDDGRVAFRTDLFSRLQWGAGDVDPAAGAWSGDRAELDGTVSCSVVVDPERVRERAGAQGRAVDAATFWKDELRPDWPLPSRVEDLVLYELHVGALNPGRSDAGDLEDALALVPHLVELGVNAVELLPISEFGGEKNWGYGTTHFSAIEESAGGADALKRFVRECHRYGIAVILDVVYNHYSGSGERAQWQYDSDAPERNVWYWYEGQPGDYAHPDGGYIDNFSSGWAPRYSEEIVRQAFIASAALFVTEFRIDGFRVDQTTSIHSYAALHADGRPADAARIFGAKFLRQWARTLRLLKPDILLMAEDHSGWADVTKPIGEGGLGFDATWYADFYHHLCGDGEKGDDYATLLRNASFADGRKLAMGYFAGALAETRDRKVVVYSESHDEAGNSKDSARTIVVAVNGAPLVGETRRWAEARCRVAAGLTVLSAATPMLFMGEEVGASQPYRYNDFADHKEDIVGLRNGDGAGLFAFYRRLVRLRRASPGLRSRNIDILHVHDANRVIAFRRWADAGDGVAEGDFLVVASLGDSAYPHGYTIGNERLPNGLWGEVLNSDAADFGGTGLGNAGGPLRAANAAVTLVLPAVGLVVLRREGE